MPGRGGAKGAVRAVCEQVHEHTFVLKTDVRSYYASIDHFTLLDRLEPYVADRRVLNLIGQYRRHAVEWGGLIGDCTRGIVRGCPLSPVLGAFFLHDVNTALDRLGVRWARYMDDIVVLTRTRWTLRRAVTVVNQGLAALGLEKHPAKTFIGRIARGFDWLGYRVSPAGVQVARATVERFVARALRLYEQQPGGAQARVRLGAYVRRWFRWVRAGVPTHAWTGDKGQICYCKT